MQTDHQRRRLILDGSQVFGQPGHLRQRHDAVVVAAAQHAVAAARIDPVNVVEYHVVHLAEVERIVVRPQRPAIGKLPRGVALHIGVVIVVAHRVEYGHGISVPGKPLPVVRKPEITVVPIPVPGHVARHEAENRHGAGIGKSLRFGDKPVFEIAQVVLLVGQVQVGAHQHDVVFGIGLHQLEVMLLAHPGLVGQSGPEAHHHIVIERSGQVTLGNRDKDIPQRLERRNPVVTVLIGGDRLQPVRHADTRHAFVAAEDNALDVHALLVGNFLVGRKVDFHRGDILLLRTANHINVVALPGDRRRYHHTGRLGRNAAYRQVEHSGVGPERNHVARLEAYSLQGQRLPGIHAHNGREVEIAH